MKKHYTELTYTTADEFHGPVKARVLTPGNMVSIDHYVSDKYKNLPRIKAAANEVPIKPPGFIKKALNEAYKIINFYTSPDDINKYKVAAGKYFGIDPSKIVPVTDGSSSIPKTFVETFLKKGQPLLMPALGFAGTEMTTSKIGVEIIHLPHIVHREGSRLTFALDIHATLKELSKKKTGALLLDIVTNPGGNSTSIDDIKKIVAQAAKYKKPVILDLAYAAFMDPRHKGKKK